MCHPRRPRRASCRSSSLARCNSAKEQAFDFRREPLDSVAVQLESRRAVHQEAKPSQKFAFLIGAVRLYCVLDIIFDSEFRN